MRKLVRDKIPRKMMDDGIDPEVRILSTAQLDKALRAKLVEEAQEVVDATTPEAFLEEMADLWEVWYTLIRHHGLLAKDAYERARDKGLDKGRFAQGFEVEIPEPTVKHHAVVSDVDGVECFELFLDEQRRWYKSNSVSHTFTKLTTVKFYRDDELLLMLPLNTVINVHAGDVLCVQAPSFS